MLLPAHRQSEREALEREIEVLALEGLKLFDPMFGGTAFAGLGPDGDVELIPTLGAEIECAAWPAGKFYEHGKHFLYRLFNAHTHVHEYGLQVCPNPLRVPADTKLQEPKPATFLQKVYKDASEVTLEAVLAHDHPRYQGSPVILQRGIRATINLIKNTAKDIGISCVDFRAFPQPSEALWEKALKELDIFKVGDVYGYKNEEKNRTRRFLDVHALQINLGFHTPERSQSETFCEEKIHYTEGDFRQITGQQALLKYMEEAVPACPEIYLALGFDGTEMHRHRHVNQRSSLWHKPGIPLAIKSLKTSPHLENGILSATANGTVGILCTLISAYCAIKDKVYRNENGDVVIMPVTDHKLIYTELEEGDIRAAYPAHAGQDEGICMSHLSEGRFLWSSCKNDPVIRVPEDYGSMIDEAKKGSVLEETLNALSGGDLGTRLFEKLKTRADLCLWQLENNCAPWSHWPQPETAARPS